MPHGASAVSEPDDRGDEASSVERYVRLVRQQIQAAKTELREGEVLRVFVCTPEGRLEAAQLEGAPPNWLIIHGARGGRLSTVIAPMESVQIAIARIPRPPDEKPRPFGFRVSD
jgi:hypothetical protein